VNSRILTLVSSWLTIDFFGDSRRTGEPGSSLTSTIFTQAFIGLLFASVFLPEDSEHSAVAYIAANLSLSTILIGIGMLGESARHRRELADEYMVFTSPLSANSLALARLLHRSFYLCLVTTGMAIPPAILCYWLCGHNVLVVGLYIVMANVVAGVMAGFLATFTQCVHLALGPARAQLLAGTLKGLLLGGGFVGFAVCLPHMTGTATDLPIGRTGALLWPPYWAAQVIDHPGSAGTFWLLLTGTAASLFLASAALYRTRRRKRYRRPERPGWLAALDQMLAGGGPLLGVTRFVATMLYRSPGFRGRVLPLFGMPAAMVMLSLWDLQDSRARNLLLGITLQFPAIFLPFLVAFLPRSDHEHAGWLFRSSPYQQMDLYRSGSLLALTTHVLLPVQLAALVALLLAGSWSIPDVLFAVTMPVFSLALGVLFAEISLRELSHKPFTTDSEHDGEAAAMGGVMAGAMGLALVGGLVSIVATNPIGWIVTIATVAFAVSRLRATRYRVYA